MPGLSFNPDEKPRYYYQKPPDLPDPLSSLSDRQPMAPVDRPGHTQETHPGKGYERPVELLTGRLTEGHAAFLYMRYLDAPASEPVVAWLTYDQIVTMIATLHTYLALYDEETNYDTLA